MQIDHLLYIYLLTPVAKQISADFYTLLKPTKISGACCLLSHLILEQTYYFTNTSIQQGHLLQYTAIFIYIIFIYTASPIKFSG